MTPVLASVLLPDKVQRGRDHSWFAASRRVYQALLPLARAATRAIAGIDRRWRS